MNLTNCGSQGTKMFFSRLSILKNGNGKGRDRHMITYSSYPHQHSEENVRRTRTGSQACVALACRVLGFFCLHKTYFNFDQLQVPGRQRVLFCFVVLVSRGTFAALKSFYISILQADESVKIYISMLLWVGGAVSP